MHFGWWHPSSDIQNPSLKSRPDAQFVLISWDLMTEILQKPYCHHSRDSSFCKATNKNVRYGSDHGGTSLGHWLGQIGNITGIRMNDRMVHTINQKKWRSPVKKPYCGPMISFHKAIPSLQRYLKCFDQDILASKRFCGEAHDMKKYTVKKH